MPNHGGDCAKSCRRVGLLAGFPESCAPKKRESMAESDKKLDVVIVLVNEARVDSGFSDRDFFVGRSDVQ